MRKFLRLMAVLLAVVLCMFASNQRIETEQITVYSASLPKQFDGFRVLLLSDLHGRTFGKDNETLLYAVRAAQPDIIALCGDLLDTETQLGQVTELAEELSAIAPCYFVTGNHEWAAGCVNELFAALQEAGVTILDDRYVTLKKNGEMLILAGFCDPNGFTDRISQSKLLASVRRENTDGYLLLLNHRNLPPERFADFGVQTVLSGHGHGGILRLPFIGGLLDTDRTLFPKYTSGLYTAGQTNLVVSRGLGGRRILSRPHLPLVILRAEK